jgi:hypothetical protein
LDEGIADTFVQWQPLNLAGILATVSMHSPKEAPVDATHGRRSTILTVGFHTNRRGAGLSHWRLTLMLQKNPEGQRVRDQQ